MTHTAIPWRLSLTDDTLVVADLPDGQQRVVQALGNYSTDEFAEMEANAAFIVRAVNCHDELVEALTNARRIILALDSSLVDGPNMNFINALLAKASLNTPAVRGGAK